MSATETPTPAIDPSQEAREQLHEFHLTGRPPGFADPLEGGPLRPIALEAIEAGEHSFPLCYEPVGPAGFRPLGALLDDLLAAEGFELLRGQAALLSDLAAQALAADKALEAPLAKAAEAALSAAAKHPALASENTDQVQSERQRLLSRLPQTTRLLALSPAAATFLHARTLADSRAPTQAVLVDRLRTLVQRLEGMLLRGGEPETAAELASELGSKSDRFLDMGKLAHSLRRTAGHQALDAERRKRLEKATQTLRSYLERASAGTMLCVLHSVQVQAELRIPGVLWIESANPLEDALARAREDLDWFSEVLRALRLGALEAEGDYRAEIHQRALARLDWRAAKPEELAGAPLCLAVESADRIANESLTALSRLLRSGMPLQTLAIRDAEPFTPEGPPDLGYLAIAHREPYVLEAPLSQAGTLLEGLRRMSRSLRPAIAVVAAQASVGQGQATWRARLTPCLRYDPDAGESWAQRFSLEGNPAPEETWAGATPADAVALDPRGRGGFAVLPAEAWNDEQTPLAEYLNSNRAAAAIPYLEVLGPDGKPLRAAITRELANLCRRTRQSWRIYQELAGVHNDFVDRAATQARTAAQQELTGEQERLAAEARRQGAESAVYRLVAALANTGELSLPAIPAATPRPALPTPADSAPAAPKPATAAPQVGPYIDSALCTSCNECINRNPKMFRYNDDKQAYIADPKAGTYQQFVKAAAACPAACIHPGPPPG